MAEEISTQLDGMPIANIVLAEIIDEVTGKAYRFDTAEDADTKADLSAGKEEILRVKNRIIAMNRTEDICIGYNTKLKNNTFTTELMSIVDGGVMTGTGYEGPEIGKVVNKHPYTLNIYTEEKDYDSSTLRYVKFSFKHNKGKPVDFKFQNGKFLVPQFESHSRPKRGEKPVYISYVSSLPTDESTPKPVTPTVPTPPTPIEPNDKKPGITVGSDCKVTWTFTNAINDADATVTNFKVTKKSDGTAISGNVTIDTTKKIVTFVPTSIAAGVTYTAQALAIRSAGSSTADTIPISVDFTTI
ncbi:hypothetical protein HBE96_06585 [Clostridium sp. P21]|uniref:SbsA Ig-like domain-containing protein n=1 Tax=Clostridium muellerianum TaxID=2716538 RepID=A0A7Y0EF34_9CLOT|nr:Ig-like domain-containing protein [Clostridium muellerianum]NMM62359.1 hypothetical protein [Clostridium muellerianum]